MSKAAPIHPCRDGSRSSAAFTLIELLAVITIMAIMCTYAVVSVTRLMKAREVTTGAHTLVATMKYAQQTAIVRGVRTRVAFLPFKNVSGISISSLTNAVRVLHVDTMLARELHRDGWVMDANYFEPRMLGQNVTVSHEGPSGNMNQYLLWTDNGGWAGQSIYDGVRSGTYKKTNGTTAGVSAPPPYLYNYNSGPNIWWANYPYMEFDSQGRATFSVTCTVMSVTSTNVGQGASPGFSGTIRGNFAKVIITRGEKRIDVQ
jgi:prepilin-type N-terminal cleavage/methylation domain-containing protein